jgi:hypothetical protein
LQRFRSIIVNDIEFFTHRASVFINGAPALVTDLVIGQVLNVEGHAGSNNRRNADLVTYRSNIIGPIEQIQVDPDLAGVASLQVLGQQAETTIRTNVLDIDLEDLAIGDVVELSGLSFRPTDDSAAEVLKVSFARSVITDQFRLIGFVDSTLPNGILQINDLLVDTTQVAGPLPAVGQRVEVIADAASLTPPNLLVAGQLTSLPVTSLPEGQSVEIEDLVNDIIDADTFRLGQRLVHTDGNTVLGIGTPLIRTPGAKLEVEGQVDANGAILASALIAKPFDAVEVEGPAEAVGLSKKDSSVTVAGLTFKVDPSADFGRSNKPEFNVTSLDEISLGDQMRIIGFADGEFLVASKINRLKPRERARLKAPVSAVDDVARTLTLRELVIQTDADTKFAINELPVDQQLFFATVAEGDFVQARWRQFTSVSEPPDEVELKR